MLQDNSPENLSRRENIDELANGMNDFCAQRIEEGNARVSLGDFLSEVSLLTDQDTDKEEDGNKVTLMTVHSAKGLEFKNVFVVGMEENLFPSNMSADSPRAIEEERRLFYVAITRAEEHCFLSYAKTRIRYGKMEFGSPSRFLKDIDAHFLSLPYDALFRRRTETGSPSQKTLFDAVARPVPQPERKPAFSPVRLSPLPSSSGKGRGEAPTLCKGQRIVHERFGMGEVVNVDGEGDNTKATIRFENAGVKQLLLRFARFKVVE